MTTADPITRKAVLAALAAGPLTSREIAYRIVPTRAYGEGAVRHVLEGLAADRLVVATPERRESCRVWALAGQEPREDGQGVLW